MAARCGGGDPMHALLRQPASDGCPEGTFDAAVNRSASVPPGISIQIDAATWRNENRFLRGTSSGQKVAPHQQRTDDLRLEWHGRFP